MHRPFVTSNHVQFTVDQKFDQSICWLPPLRPLAWLMPPQSAPWSTILISRGSTPILTVPCRLRWARVYRDRIIDSYFSWHSWYKSYVRMVGQGGEKDSHYSLNTNRNLRHHLPHKKDQFIIFIVIININGSIILFLFFKVQQFHLAPPTRISNPAVFMRSERCANCTWKVFNFTLNFSRFRTFLVHIGISIIYIKKWLSLMKGVPSQPSRHRWHFSLVKESGYYFMKKENPHAKNWLNLYLFCPFFSQNLALPPGELSIKSHILIFFWIN